MNWWMGSGAAIISAIIGISLAIIISPSLRRDRQLHQTMLPFCIAIGFAATSGLYWVWLTTLRTTGIPYLAMEWTIAVILFACAIKRWRSATPAPNIEPSNKRNWCAFGIAIVVACVLIMSLYSIIPATLNSLHGKWDAWDMWNIKAKYLHHAGPTWTATFRQTTGHGDYPLLHPITVARYWAYMREAIPAGPQLHIFVLFTLLGTLTFAGLAQLRGATAGVIGLLTLLSSSLLMVHAPSQYADLPLITMMTGAMLASVIAIEQREHETFWLFAAGALASAAAWTKNEGIVFAMILLGVMLVVLLLQKRCRAVGVILIAAAPLILCLIWLKLVYAPSNDLMKPRTFTQINALIVDPKRHERILRIGQFMLRNLTGGWLWALLGGWVIFRGIKLTHAWTVWLTVLISMTGIYYFVYLTTPQNLSWHLQTSASRIFMHLWPLLALLPMILVRSKALHANQGCSEECSEPPKAHRAT